MAHRTAKRKGVRALWNGNKVKSCIVIVSTALALVFMIYKLDDRYLKAEEGPKLEKKVVQTLEMFQMKMEEGDLRRRLDTLKDQKRQIKLMLKKTPADTDLLEQFNEVNKQQDSVEKRIKELESTPWKK